MSDDKLSLSKQDLRDEDFSEDSMKEVVHPFPITLLALDLSRNHLTLVPKQVFHLSNLKILNVNRNSLRSLPCEIKDLSCLVELHALSNNFRLRQLPMEELASLKELRLLDLRFNSKLKQAAHDTLTKTLSAKVEIRCTIPDRSIETHSNNSNKLSACDRDATLLRSQLEPASTPQLIKRLERTFGVYVELELKERQQQQQLSAINRDKDEDETTRSTVDTDALDLAFDREYVMKRLLSCYEKRGPRTIRYERGIPVRSDLMQEIWEEMEAIPWPHTTRERPKVKAEHYIILQKPGTGQIDSTRTKKETAKLHRYRRIFDKAVQALSEVDPEYANRFTAVAVTKNFTGSPHIDTLNVAPFYGLSLGDYSNSQQGQGNIAVECSDTLVAHVDTNGRLAKVDGRFPHWVTPYEGTRYSLIYYVTSGEVIPKTTAIFEPCDELVGTSTVQ